MLHRRSLSSCFLLLGVIVFAGGCNKSTTSSPPPTLNPQAGQGQPDTGPFAAGRKIFAGSGCAKCHSTGGTPTAGAKGGKQMGPDLSKVGSDPDHTTEWLAAKIRDPHVTKPQSRMPKHDEGKINENDMNALVEYLSSMK
jgi:cbb3-type cytochrome oxidase cytochrome c subunit